MKKNFLRRLASEYIKGTASVKQKALLDAYAEHKETYASPHQTDEQMQARILKQINLKIASAEHPRRKLVPWYWAAAVVIAVSLATIIINKTNTKSEVEYVQLVVTTKKGEKKKVVLPDGSTVVLNSGSLLRYAANFNGPLRNIDLQGEAYFDVAHNAKKPFIVHSKRIDIRVLGTQFNIKAYDGENPEASLIRGVVQIFLPKSNHALITLKPNEKFILESVLSVNSSKQLVARGKDFVVTAPKQTPAGSETKSIAWVQNRLSFDDQGFKEVAALLERWYDVSITIDNPALLKYRFTGTFNDTGLIDILDALKASQDFNYRKEGERITIY